MSSQDSTTAPPAAPSLISGHAQYAQGVVYEAIGNISSDPSWSTAGADAKKAGEEELERVKADASSGRLWGKAESGLGMLTGNQETQKEGNLEAEKGEWKASLADGKLPSISTERASAKVESAIGMVTGDSEKQTQGNIKAEKAEWTKG